MLLQELFLDSACRHPESVAVICGAERLSYGKLAHLGRALAAQLQRLGVRPAEPVAVVMRKGCEQVVGTLAILIAGGAYLPIDPDVPAERLDLLLGKAGVRFAVTQSDLRDRLRWPVGVQALLIDGDVAGDEEVITPPELTDESMACLIYTSGSTGTPKGAMIAHRGLVNCIRETNSAFHVGECDRAIAITSLQHDMSAYDVFGMLAAAGSIIMPRPSEARDPAAWVRLIREQKVTIWNSVPAFFQMLADHIEAESANLRGTVRLIFQGGDWIPLEAPRRAKLAFGDVEFTSVGGPTETTLWNIWYRVGDVDFGWRSIPYGKPIPGVQYHILDDNLNDCPANVGGEMWCSGVGLMLGYWEDQESTAARFAVHPQSGERIYRTGDRGRWLDDGNIEFLGRTDHQVKIHGLRIELGEIEAALMRICGGNRSVALVRELACGEKQLVALVQGECGLSEMQILKELRETLPAPLVPTSVRSTATLPLTPNGKIDRPKLIEQWNDQPTTSARHMKPSIETVAEVWREVLGLDEVTSDTNFFDAGGSSLALVRTQAELQRRIGRSIPLTRLLRFPTVRGLAASLDDEGTDAHVPGYSLEQRALRQKEALLRQGHSARLRR